MHIEYFLSYVCIYVHYVLALGSEVSVCLEGLFTPYSASRWGFGVKRDEGLGVCTDVGDYRAEEEEAEAVDALHQGSALGCTQRTG